MQINTSKQLNSARSLEHRTSTRCSPTSGGLSSPWTSTSGTDGCTRTGRIKCDLNTNRGKISGGHQKKTAEDPVDMSADLDPGRDEDPVLA